MGSSYGFYKKEVKNCICKNFNTNVEILDVGAGEGTYSYLLRNTYKNIDAVEVYKRNIEDNHLEDKYRRVYWEDIRNFRYKWYDLVIFGDVLEHLTVKEAQKVLKYAIEHSLEVIVAVPYMYKQGKVGDNVYEIHKQDDLTEERMEERYPELKLLYGNEFYGYYVKKDTKIKK